MGPADCLTSDSACGSGCGVQALVRRQAVDVDEKHKSLALENTELWEGLIKPCYNRG